MPTNPLPDHLSWDTQEAFYSEREERRRSPEHDYGVMWIENARRNWPNWRVSHVVDTDEVIAVRMANPDTVVLLADQIPLDDFAAAMKGWADGTHKQLVWVVRAIEAHRERLASLRGGKALVFEDSTSQLTVSNDGRVRIMTDPDRRKAIEYVIEVDAHESWRTRNRLLADAFIAGWDARAASVDAEIAQAR